MGYGYVALTDTNGVYGAVELHQAARKYGVKAIVGSTLNLQHDGKAYPVVLLAGSRQGYATLNGLIDLAKQNKGQTVTLSQLETHTRDLHLLTGGRWGFPSQLLGQRKVGEAVYLLEALKHAFKDRLWLQIFYDAYPWDMRRAKALRAFGREHGIPAVAAPEVRYATSDLFPLTTR